MSLETKIWLGIGILGQSIFTGRFLVQWLASERRRESVIPVSFWWLSLFGGTTLLIYAVHREDPVFIVGQTMGVFIYARNLVLVDQAKRAGKPKRRKARPARADAPAPAAPKPRLGRRVEGAAEGSSIVR